MIKLIKNADVYAPEHIGIRDILVVGEKICRIAEHIDGYDDLPEAEIYDASGMKALPGYIDMHVHITGGGGEQGPSSRVPESQLSVFTTNGITTVVGLLGTDGITRSVENLVAKARALTEEGITAYALTSSYGYPPTTITESVEKDIMMIPPIIGVKVAVSDHRSSNPTGEELIRLATQARRGGLLSGTAGLVTMHMGSGKAVLDPVFYALDNSDIPPKNFLPTHMARTNELLAQGAELIRRGGNIDITAGCDDQSLEEIADKIVWLLSLEGVTTEHVSMTSDAYGSQPRFDEEGNCIGLTYASPKYLHATIKGLVKRGLELEDAVKMLTSTPAEILGKTGKKGCLREGADADILMLRDNLEIDSVFARGKTAIWHNTVLMKGKFE